MSADVIKKDKEYFSGGDKVQIKGGHGPIMTVMRVMTKRRRRDDVWEYRTIGVLCTWTDDVGITHNIRCQTKELELVKE